MEVVIDKTSGFCTGVVNAIKKAEEELSKDVLYCIGDIVHNNLEVERLQKKGLITIDHDQFSSLKSCRVLFRAHGEPPSTYETAFRNGIEVIDASCPVVLYLQKQIREAYEEIKKHGGQIIIYGKKGHAEVVGLVGQTNGEAIVIEETGDVEKLNFDQPTILFSQTTMSLEGFQKLQAICKEKGGNRVTVYDTICRKVANRIPELIRFASVSDVVLFVSSEKSSNGRQLFKVCQQTNPRSYFIHGKEDLKPEMVCNAEKIGISGATSTPLWIMEEIKETIINQF